MQVGVGKAKVKNVSNAERAAWPRQGRAQAQAGRVPRRAGPPDSVGEIMADHFVAGQFVDVTGVTTGKGFAGGMKRWNFGGLQATRRIDLAPLHRFDQRPPGPGKTFKNKKMPGHLGTERVTTPARGARPRPRPDPGRGAVPASPAARICGA
jgi:large subunit ribosomal protein L3